MKDIKTKEVTTKPKTKNPASRIPKELMRTAILESKEKSQTIANARDNDMGEQSPSEYASGKVTSAEEWAARKTGRTVTRAGKTAAQTSYEKIKQRAVGKKEVEKEAEKETARGTGDTQTADPASRETPEQKSREVQIQKAQRQKAVSDAVKTKEQKIRAARETPRIQNGQEIAEDEAALHPRDRVGRRKAKDTVRQTAIRQKQPETIRIKEKPRKQPEPKTIQKRTIKTAPPVCEDQRPARAEAPCDQFQRPDGSDAEADGTKGSEAGGKESCHADFQQRPPDAENGKGRAEYLQGSQGRRGSGSENRAVHDGCTGSRRSSYRSSLGHHGWNRWRCGIFWKLGEQRSTQPGSPFLYGNHPEICQPVRNPRICFRDTGDHDAGIRRPGNRSYAE